MIFSTVLVIAPVAFIVGWLVAKAAFTRTSHDYTLPVERRAHVEPEAETAGVRVSDGINALRKQLEVSRGECEALKNETRLLKESVAEREHALAEAKSVLQAQASPPEEGSNSIDSEALDTRKMFEAQHRRLQDREAQMAELEQKLAAAEQQAQGRAAQFAELEQKLAAAEQQVQGASDRFDTWKRRLAPLADQYRQQKIIIKELRIELSEHQVGVAVARASETFMGLQRDLLEDVSLDLSSSKPAIPANTPVTNSSRTDANDLVAAAAPAAPAPKEQRDNLQVLPGVGPVLQSQLYAAGMVRLAQFAELNEAELSVLGEALCIPPERLHKYGWIRKAQDLVREGAAETA